MRNSHDEAVARVSHENTKRNQQRISNVVDHNAEYVTRANRLSIVSFHNCKNWSSSFFIAWMRKQGSAVVCVFGLLFYCAFHTKHRPIGGGGGGDDDTFIIQNNFCYFQSERIVSQMSCCLRSAFIILFLCTNHPLIPNTTEGI